MARGVFFRKFTKYNDYTNVTALGKVHTHLFILGMPVFLIVALYAAHNNLNEIKAFRAFMCIYNTSVPLTAAMLLLRGILQVRGTAVSAAVSASVSGIASIGHILTGIGIILLLISFKKLCGNKG